MELEMKLERGYEKAAGACALAKYKTGSNTNKYKGPLSSRA